MAYCNNRAGCGHDCGRQDNHGGDCDCYEDDCKSSSRYRPPPAPKPEPPKPLATFYAIRRGTQYYHTYTRAGSTGWVDKLEDAKLWTRPGPAKGKITVLAAEAPKDPLPELVEFLVTEIRVIDQVSRVAEAKAKKEREEAASALARRQRELQDAQREVDKAQEKLKRLQEAS